MITLTDRAAEAVASAQTAARRFDPAATVRLAPTDDGRGVLFEFTDAPGSDDSTLDGDGFTLIVAPGLEGVLDTGDHNQPVLTPS